MVWTEADSRHTYVIALKTSVWEDEPKTLIVKAVWNFPMAAKKKKKIKSKNRDINSITTDELEILAWSLL